jgi:hypothetical protein
MIRGLPLRLELVRALPLALLACAAAWTAFVEPPAPVERPATVGTIDFDALHRQASAALESLRHSHERRRRLAALADAS